MSDTTSAAAGPNVVYVLDRTLDGAPPFFALWRHDPPKGRRYNIARHIPVRGQNYWGDGWTWEQAETATLAAIEADNG